MCRVCCGVQLEQPGGRGGRAKRANRAGAVESAGVVIRVDRLGDLALHLEANQKRFEERRARRADAFGDGEGRHERRKRRMRQQAIGAIGRGRQLRIVVVHRVPAGAVGQRGVGRRRHQSASNRARWLRSSRGRRRRTRGRSRCPGWSSRPGSRRIRRSGIACPARRLRAASGFNSPWSMKRGNRIGGALDRGFLQLLRLDVGSGSLDRVRGEIRLPPPGQRRCASRRVRIVCGPVACDLRVVRRPWRRRQAPIYTGMSGNGCGPATEPSPSRRRARALTTGTVLRRLHFGRESSSSQRAYSAASSRTMAAARSSVAAMVAGAAR